MRKIGIVLAIFLLIALSACGISNEPMLQSKEPTFYTAVSNPPITSPAHTSPIDYNANGVDDYTDILLGARADAQARPRYDASYFSGGYPPEDAGVCTDLVWRAFKRAGYDLKAMVDRDIAQNTSKYPRVEGRPDKNIDFRRTANLKVFFERHATVLTTDITQADEWQPGDIVTFGTWHSAIVSDKRNASGRPYILHNMGQYEREADDLAAWGVGGDKGVSGHFRWDASKISGDVLAAWG